MEHVSVVCHMEPENLVDLALDALGKHVYMLCVNLKSTAEAELISKRIYSSLAESLPITLADKATNKLLSNLDHWINEGEFDKGQQAMCELMIKSIIHPAVTRIEPRENVNTIPELFRLSGFESACCPKTILKKVKTLGNLRVLNVLHCIQQCKAEEIEFPEQLVEFSGLCNNEVIIKIAKSCKFLKVLNVLASTNVTDKSTTAILKMKHLEKLNISGTSISDKGIKKLLQESIKKYGKSYSLRYLMTSVSKVLQFNKIMECLPNLKVILHNSSYFLLSDLFLQDVFGCLPYYQNVIGLDVHVTFPELKTLLRNIGHQLIYFSVHVAVDDDDIDTDNNFEISKIFPIGQYCTSLKCLEVSWSTYNCPVIMDNLNVPLPGFQSISNLIINIEWKFHDYEYMPRIDIVKFLLFHCVNVKKVLLPLDWCIFRKYDLINTAIEMGCLQNLEECDFQLRCRKCHANRMYDNDCYDKDKDNEIVQMLIDNCPNLRFVGGVPGLDKNHPHNTQRLKFSSEFI